MQTFLPYSDFQKSLEVLDYRRLGKQRVEAKQILNVLLDRTQTKGWRNHPIVRMWNGYEPALQLYHNLCIEEWINQGYNNNMLLETITDKIVYPPWFGNEKFHSSHRGNLLRKDYNYYSQFNWSENSELPYVWLDTDKKQYYEQVVGTGVRNYL
jgi:hypothetical protein